MITTANYFETIKGINISALPENLKKGHEFIVKSTENGDNWKAYENGENTKKVVDLIFSKLDAFISSQKNTPSSRTESKGENKPEREVKTQNRSRAKQKVSKTNVPAEDENDFSFVERIPDEIRFIKRYLSLHNKKKSKEDLLRFINALHRSIIEKKIRKASPYSKQIVYIQEKLVARFNDMEKPMTMQLSDKIINEFKEVIASEKVMPSVQLIKRYINLNGKYGVKEKAKMVMEAMKLAAQKGKVLKSDTYAKILDTMYKNLDLYVKNKTQKILSIQQTELNGLNGVLQGCGCNAMHGIDEDNQLQSQEATSNESSPAQEGVMNSMDFNKMRFKTLGFKGKYRALIGDPSQGFSTMVFGRPKMGKSFLCVDFAGYLARNHGTVLYVAKEEGLDMTLQDKLKANDVAHPNLFVTQDIPEDLDPYDFIFLDSVNKLELSSQDLQTLKQNYPDKSFVYIFQTTKDGKFKGANEFAHDVDVVIEIPEKGLAIQNGRFNQGGEMRIFATPENIIV